MNPCHDHTPGTTCGRDPPTLANISFRLLFKSNQLLKTKKHREKKNKRTPPSSPPVGRPRPSPARRPEKKETSGPPCAQRLRDGILEELLGPQGALASERQAPSGREKRTGEVGATGAPGGRGGGGFWHLKGWGTLDLSAAETKTRKKRLVLYTKRREGYLLYIYIWYPPPGTYLFEEFTGICSVFYPFLGFGESNEKEAFPRTFWKLQA